jgi:uncharacterized membrane protein YedE/YeeE
MSLDLSPAVATQLVVWGALALGLALGVAGQASRFCVRGAIADWVLERRPGRFFSWMLAIAVGALCVQALISLRVFDAGRTLAWSDRLLWASYLVGGTLFGFGMILAGGCPQRNLVKSGSGNLKALITLVVTAIAAQMTLRGLFAGLRVSLLDTASIQLTGSQDLGQVFAPTLGLAPGVLRWVLVVFALVGVLVLAVRYRTALKPAHWWGGIAVGLLVAVAYFLTGSVGFLAEHPQTLEAAWLGTATHRPEGLSFTAPMGNALDLLTLWTDKSTVATFGVMLSLGVVIGSFASAKWRSEFKLESVRTPRELGAHVTGGVLMGFGGITAAGCSVGQGVTGMAMLSTGAVLAVAGIVAGALLALKLRRANARTPGVGSEIAAASI